MAIPLTQLESWSHQGGTTISSQAYASITHALTKSASPLSRRKVRIYLHGSYANATNTHGDSDIDVVVLYEDTFYKDMSLLPPLAQQAHEQLFGPVTYSSAQLRNDVLSALNSHFGISAVTVGTKAIKVQTASGRMTADVLPAVEFRRYATFVDTKNLTAHWGIHFFDSSGNGITNYPEYHIKNGEAKNQTVRTQGQYKSTIRLFKNMRSYLVDHGLLSQGIAPSYFIEGALYNMPDAHFRGSFSTSVPAIIQYLLLTPYSGFLSQNGVVPLIGTGPTQWRKEDFAAFVVKADALWKNWPYA